MLGYLNDLQFVDSIVKGDEQAADDFLRQFLPLFDTLARRARIPTQDCPDIAQDICLAAISQMKRGLFRGESKLATWLVTVAKGKIADYWRIHSPSSVFGSLGISATFSLDEMDAGLDSPASTAGQKLHAPFQDYDLIVSVREALQEMPPLHCGILLLNRSEGRSVAEICRIYGMTKAQVYGRLKQAEEMFRRALQP